MIWIGSDNTDLTLKTSFLRVQVINELHVKIVDGKFRILTFG